MILLTVKLQNQASHQPPIINMTIENDDETMKPFNLISKNKMINSIQSDDHTASMPP